MAGKSKLTSELSESICKTLGAGVDFETAAIREGVSRATVYNWLKWGREGKQPYASFVVAAEAAMANVETAVTANILRASKSQWGAGAWWLKWKHTRGAQLVRVEAGGPGSATGHGSGPAQLTPEAADAIRRQILFGDQKPRALPTGHEGEAATQGTIDAVLDDEKDDFGTDPRDPGDDR